jgi:hypothetical protein
MNLLKVEPGSDIDTQHDGSQDISIKVEEVSDIKKDDVPVLITFPVRKVEDEVSCVCQCTLLGICLRYTGCDFVFLIPVCSSTWNVSS